MGKSSYQIDAAAIFAAAKSELPARVTSMDWQVTHNKGSTSFVALSGAYIEVSGITNALPLLWEKRIEMDGRVMAVPSPNLSPQGKCGGENSAMLASAGIVEREVGRLKEPLMCYLPEGWADAIELSTMDECSRLISGLGYQTEVRVWRREFATKLLAPSWYAIVQGSGAYEVVCDTCRCDGEGQELIPAIIVALCGAVATCDRCKRED